MMLRQVPTLVLVSVCALQACGEPVERTPPHAAATKDGPRAREANDGAVDSTSKAIETADPAEVAAPRLYATHEFKFTIKGTDDSVLDPLAKIVKSVAEVAPDRDQKKCRKVVFYDTSDGALGSRGYSLRIREKLDKKNCEKATKTKSWDAAWKWRGDPVSAHRVHASQGKTPSPSALERDASWGAGGLASERAAFTYQAIGEGTPPPASEMGGFAGTTIKNLLSGKTLEPRCAAPIYQHKWELRTKSKPVKEFDISGWSYERGGPFGTLEVSFKIKGQDPKAGQELAEELRAELETAGLLIPPQSKSRWAQENCPTP